VSTFVVSVRGDYAIGTPWFAALSGNYQTSVDEPTAFAWSEQWSGSVQKVWVGEWLPLS
jgi:hypothetical protein